LLFFACKKDNTNTPAVVGKEHEVSGMVIDFETGKPLEGVEISLVSTSTKRIFSMTIPDKNFALSNNKGKYKFKFTPLDSISYSLRVAKDFYTQFDGIKKCEGCYNLVSPYTFQGATSEFNLTDTFYMAKAGKVKVHFDLQNAKNDTLSFAEEFQYYNGLKINNENTFFLLLTNSFSGNFWHRTTLADRMTYLTWKLKSETVWHQDSIMTPFGKTVDFEIKY
jgi:hypothetical protein